MQREHKLDAEGVKTALERIVDEHAQAKVDRIVHCGFVLPWGTVPPGLKSFDRLPEKPLNPTFVRVCSIRIPRRGFDNWRKRATIFSGAS